MTQLSRWIVGVLMIGCSVVQAEDIPSSSAGASFVKKPLAYEVTVAGGLPPEVITFVEERTPILSTSSKFVRHQPALHHAFDQAIPEIQKLLEQKGYCETDISVAVLKTPKRVNGRKVLSVTLYIQPGPRYTVQDVVFKGVPEDIASANPKTDLSYHGKPFDLDHVMQGCKTVSTLLNQKGYPFHTWSQPHLVIDHTTQTVHVQVDLEPGPFVRFGPTEIQGLKTVGEPFVRNQLAWKEGEVFDEDRIKRTRKKLGQLNLFSSVVIHKDDASGLVDSRVPMNVQVTEQAHRYMGFGLKYSRLTRIGGKVFWGHHNFFGSGEHLEVMYRSSHIERVAQVSLKKRDLGRLGQTLVTRGVWGRENTPAYINSFRGLDGVLEYDLTPYWRLTWGGMISWAQMLNADTDKGTLTVGVPCHLRYASTSQEAWLEDQEGWTVTMTLAPYGVRVKDQKLLDVSQGNRLGRKVLGILDQRVKGTLSQGLGRKLVAAGWVEVGALAGPRFQDIPADRRYYAGGLGSVRGYSLQKAQAFVKGKRPEGGNGLLQGGIELRWKYTPLLSMVTFVEGAKLSPNMLQGLKESPTFIGYGVGARYQSEVGMFRFDLAFPTRKRSVDSAFEFYAGLGQSF